MSDFIDSDSIRELADDYYYQRITLQEYRTQRKILLDKIDKEINGAVTTTEEDKPESGLLGKAVAFFTNKTNELETNK